MTTLELDIERPVAGGHMLARHDGRVVFVAGAVPGERVRAVVTRRKGQIAWAEVRDVISASPDRRPVDGDPLCGGRLYAHIAYPRQLALKADVIADAFRRLAKSPLTKPVDVVPSPETGYRVRARLHVDRGRVGFLREGSHAVCAAGPTGQVRDEMLTAVDALLAAPGHLVAQCASILVSEETSGPGRVATCVLREGATMDPFLGMDLPRGFSAVVVQARRGEFTAAGVDRLIERSGDLPGNAAAHRPVVEWQRRGAAFFQGNRFLVGPLLDTVLAAAAGRFVDLYAGVGLFAVALAARGERGVAVEGDAIAAGDLAVNAAQWRERLETRAQSVEAAVSAVPASTPDVVVVDPPRTGLSPDVVNGLLRWRMPRLVYVSCDVPTLARDAQRLLAGGYRLTSLQALDMFPNTPHVECVAVFDRA